MEELPSVTWLLDVEVAPLPMVVEFEATEEEPVEKRATAKAQMKLAKLETGAELQVPSYIVAGERVRVDTRDGHFIERAKG